MIRNALRKLNGDRLSDIGIGIIVAFAIVSSVYTIATGKTLFTDQTYSTAGRILTAVFLAIILPILIRSTLKLRASTKRLNESRAKLKQAEADVELARLEQQLQDDDG